MDNLYIQKVRNGDYAAFSYFIDKYRDMAYSIAFRIVNNSEDAEEIVQDSFVKAFKSLSKFRQDAKFSTWFYRIVVNSALSKVERKKPKADYIDLQNVSDVAIEEIESTYSHLNHSDQKKYINIALNGLNTEESLLLTLYYLNENSFEEIAEITGIKKDNLKMKIHRARLQMYVVLEKVLKSEIQNLL